MLTLRLPFASLVLAAALAAQVPGEVPEPAAPPQAPVAARDDAAAEQLGWKLGVQAWTFRDRTAFEAIDTARALGLKYIELYPGQKLSPKHGDAKVGPEMNFDLLQALKQKLASAKVTAMAFGVTGFTTDETTARRTFEFCHQLGIGTITCEPDTNAWDLVAKLAEEYKIDIACHDHPKPSHYWNPETVLAAVKDRNQHLGACADTGHWPRSGLDPVASLKLLAGRIRSLHFKDIAPANAKGEDKPWGTGEGKAHDMLVELRRQGFRGLFSIEYETGAGKELEANVALCIKFFDDETRKFLTPAKAEPAK